MFPQTVGTPAQVLHVHLAQLHIKIMVFTTQQSAQFDELYRAATNADDTRLVKLKDDMLRLLLAAGECKRKHVHVKSMAVHPQNRGGSKMEVLKVYSKGAKIIAVGVSWTKCGPDVCIAFEDDPAKRHIAKAAAELSRSSTSFAQYDEGQVEGGSVGAGHWNQFLAAIEDGREVPPMYRDRLCEHGRTCLDKERLCRGQPVLREILEKGLVWSIVSWRIESRFPRLPNIFQKALNVEHHIGEGGAVDLP